MYVCVCVRVCLWLKSPFRWLIAIAWVGFTPPPFTSGAPAPGRPAACCLTSVTQTMEGWVEVVRKRGKSKGGKGKAAPSSSSDPIMMIAQALGQLLPAQGVAPLAEGKASKPPRKTPLPPTDKVRATPTIEEWGCPGCGRYNWMTRLYCRQCGDHRPLAPGVWSTEGSQPKAAPGTPGNSLYKQTVLAPSAQGGEASKPTGKGRSPGDVSTKSTAREQAAARAESLEKALASITEGGDATVKKHLTEELAKAKQAAQDPRPKGARLDSAEAELRRHQQKMDSLTDQRAKLDEQIKECAASIRTAEDRLEEARQAWIESEADPKPDKKAQTIELNYEEFMHIGKMLEHFVGLTSTAGTSEGGPVRRKLPGGSVVAEGDPLGGEAFQREAQRTLAVLGDKAIQMRAANPDFSSGLPTYQAGGSPHPQHRRRSRSSFRYTSARPRGYPDTCHPRGAGERGQRWRGIPPSPDPHPGGLDSPGSTVQPPAQPRRRTDERQLGDIVLREHTSISQSPIVFVFIACFLPLFWFLAAWACSLGEVCHRKIKGSTRQTAHKRPAAAAMRVSSSSSSDPIPLQKRQTEEAVSSC